MYKLLMSWNIRPGREAEYFEFVVSEFAPGLVRLGLPPTEAWYAVYGDCPKIMTYSEAENAEMIEHIQETGEWQTLFDKLGEYVTDYAQKIVPSKSRFQL